MIDVLLGAEAATSIIEHGWQATLILLLVAGFGVVGRWLLGENSKHRQTEIDILQDVVIRATVEITQSSDDRKTAIEERKADAAIRTELMSQLKAVGEFSRETVRAFDSATRHQMEAVKEEEKIIDGLREIQKNCGANPDSIAADAAAYRSAQERKRTKEQDNA